MPPISSYKDLYYQNQNNFFRYVSKIAFIFEKKKVKGENSEGI